MDIEFLKNLLPDVEEDALNSILSTHQQGLSTLTTANAQLSQDLSAARYDIALETGHRAPSFFQPRRKIRVSFCRTGEKFAHRGGKTPGLWGVSAASLRRMTPGRSAVGRWW